MIMIASGSYTATTTSFRGVAMRPPRPVAATSRKMAALIYALAILYPIHRTVGINVSFGDPIVALLAGQVLFGFVTGRVPIPPFVPYLGMLALTVVASLLVNTILPNAYFVTADGITEAIKLLAVVMWLFATFWLLRVDTQRRFLKFAATSVAVASLWSLYTLYENVFHGAHRLTGPFENANIYGNYLVLNVALAFGVSHLLQVDPYGRVAGGSPRLRRYRSPLLMLAQLVLLLGIFSTGSRGTLLAYATVLIICARFWFPRRVVFSRLLIGLAGLTLTGATIVWYFSQHPFLVTRIERTGDNERSVDDRLALWAAARDAFYTHPGIGIGYGQFRYYASLTHGTVEKVTHETYLSFAAELGLIGLVLWVAMMAAVLFSALRWRLTVGDGLSTIAFAFIAASCIQAFFNNVDQFRSLWIAIGLVAAIGAARKRERAA